MRLKGQCKLYFHRNTFTTRAVLDLKPLDNGNLRHKNIHQLELTLSEDGKK
jgi:hypothetical protein